MSVLNLHPDSFSCSKEEINLFSLPPTQTVIESSVINRVNTISSYNASRDAPLEFNIPSASDFYIDPNEIYLKVQGQILNGDDTVPDTTNELYPENNILHTMFNDVEILLNDVTVTSTPSNYAYKCYIQDTLNYSKGAKKSHLQNTGYYCHKEQSAHSAKYQNSTTKVFEVYGKLQTDITMQPRLILNGTEMKIVLHRNRPQFYLHCDATAAANDPYIRINTAYLLVRRVKLSPQAQLSIEAGLRTHTAKYPITRVEVKTVTVQSGISTYTIDKLCYGSLPKRIIVGLTSHVNMDGQYNSNPFKFEPFNLTSIAMYMNGHCLGVPIECSFPPNAATLSLCSRGFDSIFSSAAGLDDVGNDISLEDYSRNGYTFFAFNLDQDNSCDCGDFINPLKRGDVSLSLVFGTALSRNISVVAYMEYVSLVEIDRARNVILNK